ncbi:MAG: hypothetical protein Tsb009_17880 [Planctomycetaceae bacterium]
MAIRSNHYELAFEEYLRSRRTAHVAVDEQRRALLSDNSLKSMDFIVYSSQSVNLLVDVKGRRFPSGGESGHHKWENWTTPDELASLDQWEQVFGEGFRAILVFAYHICQSRYLSEVASPYRFRDRVYAFYGVWANEYRNATRTRSISWDTVSVSSEDFHQMKRPIDEFL